MKKLIFYLVLMYISKIACAQTPIFPPENKGITIFIILFYFIKTISIIKWGYILLKYIKK